MADSDSKRARLRPATQQDRFRIRRWLREPAVAAWWGNTASVEAEINLAMTSEAARCSIIEDGGADVGYAHAVEVGLWQEARPREVAPGTWDMDLFVVAEAHREQRLAAAAIDLLAAEVFATTLAVACCGTVSIRNEAAARAYEQGGFRWLRIWHDPLLGPAWLMLKERPTVPPPAR